MIENKYAKLYNKIIQNRILNPLNKKEIYTENHHIIPVSLGGSDENHNLVRLSAREHFLCHYLLVKCFNYKSQEWFKMVHAFSMMQITGENQKRYVNSKLYSSLKEYHSLNMSKIQSGDSNSTYGKIWIHNLELESNLKIYPNDLEIWINKGYVKGRVMNFYNKKKELERIANTPPRKYNKGQKEKYIPGKAKLNRELKYRNLARSTFEQFMNSNCDSVNQFVKQGYYNKSVVNLTMLWIKYVPEYNTTQGTSIKNKKVVENRENFEIST